MSRIRQGFELAGVSWRTLKGDRSLATFPVLGAITAVAAGAAFAIPGILLLAGTSLGSFGWIGIVLLAVAAYLASFVTIFFGVALAACAQRSLQGEDTTVRQGISAARERIPQIAKWAAVVTTVNLVIRAIESRFDGIGGAIIAGLGGLAWSLVTFLALPIIAFEGLGPWATLRRSAGLFRERWGQQVGGLAITAGVVGLIGFIPAVILVVAGFAVAGALGITLIVIGVVLFAVTAVISSALSQILAVALYRFAADGVAVGPFTEAQLQSVAGPRRGRRGRHEQAA